MFEEIYIFLSTLKSYLFSVTIDCWWTTYIKTSTEICVYTKRVRARNFEILLGKINVLSFLSFFIEVHILQMYFHIIKVLIYMCFWIKSKRMSKYSLQNSDVAKLKFTNALTMFWNCSLGMIWPKRAEEFKFKQTCPVHSGINSL